MPPERSDHDLIVELHTQMQDIVIPTLGDIKNGKAANCRAHGARIEALESSISTLSNRGWGVMVLAIGSAISAAWHWIRN